MLSQRRRAQMDMVGLLTFEVVAVVVLHGMAARPDVGIAWADFGGWLAATPVDQLVVSIVWLVALALAWWTLGSTLLYLVVRIRGLRAGARIAERLAFPMVRQVVDRAVTTTLVTTALLGTAPAALAAEPSVPLVVQQQSASEYEPEPAGTEDPDRGGGRPPSDDGGLPGPLRRAPDPVNPPGFGDGSDERGGGRDRKQESDDAKGRSGGKRRNRGDQARETAQRPEADTRARAGSEAEGRRAHRGERTADDRRADEGRAGDRSTGDRTRGQRGDDDRGDDRRQARTAGRGHARPRPGGAYTVRVGDHLWKIATEVVAADGGTTGRRGVATYWAELVRAATPQLRSGDPNLIYPGETLELPPLRSGNGDGR